MDLDFIAAPKPKRKPKVQAWAKTKSEHQTEKDVETYLCERWEALGGITRKWSSPGYTGVPDRILIHKRLGGRPLLVEVKAPGKPLSPAQVIEHPILAEQGMAVFVVDSKVAVDTFLADVTRIAKL